jgi:aryl-alcohol dehydrogenase-like predicted oxidoreductase
LKLCPRIQRRPGTTTKYGTPTCQTGNPTFTKPFTDKTWRIADTLAQVAREIGRGPVQVARNW